MFLGHEDGSAVNDRNTIQLRREVQEERFNIPGLELGFRRGQKCREATLLLPSSLWSGGQNFVSTGVVERERSR